jgi:hypothetical protein
MSVKDAYVKKVQAKMEEWHAEIERLKAKADEAEADTQLEYYKHVGKLRSLHNAVSDKLAHLKEAGDEAWEDLKHGVDSAWDALSKALKSATDKFK